MSTVVAVACLAALLVKGAEGRKPAAGLKVEVFPSDDASAARPGGPPSSSLTLTFMEDGITGWSDLPGSKIHGPPEFMLGIPTTIPSSTLKGGSTVRFHCPDDAGYVLCDAYVLHYYCPPCESNLGGLTEMLTSNDFLPSRCTPTFTSGVAGGIHHKLKGWRKSILPGTTETFKTPGDAELLVFAIDGTGVDCSANGDLASCEDPALGGICDWDIRNEACVHNYCPPGNQRGPVSGCDVCISDELA